ncbi:tail fiber assembly protein [Siccibacter colletis]|uniref:tail fiber assembly protein n=1 Tax=Siccibacter colletis TaxID=1505757 RepID=UPI0004E265F2|nr:tail assembly chaperone [Siccibacter colletis]
MKMLFSPSVSAFYEANWERNYKANDNWPNDLTEVEESIYIEFSQQPPEGKMLGEVNNFPAWIDLPGKTQSEIKEINASIKNALLFDAITKISIWQAKLLMGRISDADKAKLDAWLDYIDSLELLNINEAKDIIWPVPPEA